MSRRHADESSRRARPSGRGPFAADPRVALEPLTPLTSLTSRDAERSEIGEQLEWEMDCLVELLGRLYDQTPDSPAFTDEWFFAWLARELRECPDPNDDELWSAEDAAAVARRIQGRVRAAHVPMGLLAGGPDMIAPQRAGTIERTIQDATEAGFAPRLDLAPAAGLGRELWDEECESWVVLPPELPRGRHIALTVSGDSMTPLLHAGDVILVRLGPAVVRGSVVVARHADDGYVIKRVGAVGGTTVELCSLNPEFPPIHIPRRDEAILGTVILRWCDHGGRQGR